MKAFKTIGAVFLTIVFVSGMVACGDKCSETTAVAVPETGTYPENGLDRDGDVTLELAMFDSGIGLEWIQYAIDTFMESFTNVTINMIASPTIDTIIPSYAGTDPQDKQVHDQHMGPRAWVIGIYTIWCIIKINDI